MSKFEHELMSNEDDRSRLVCHIIKQNDKYMTLERKFLELSNCFEILRKKIEKSAPNTSSKQHLQDSKLMSLSDEIESNENKYNMKDLLEKNQSMKKLDIEHDSPSTVMDMTRSGNNGNDQMEATKSTTSVNQPNSVKKSKYYHDAVKCIEVVRNRDDRSRLPGNCHSIYPLHDYYHNAIFCRSRL
jgi:hypothetical protein